MIFLYLSYAPLISRDFSPTAYNSNLSPPILKVKSPVSPPPSHQRQQQQHQPQQHRRDYHRPADVPTEQCLDCLTTFHVTDFKFHKLNRVQECPKFRPPSPKVPYPKNISNGDIGGDTTGVENQGSKSSVVVMKKQKSATKEPKFMEDRPAAVSIFKIFKKLQF